MNMFSIHIELQELRQNSHVSICLFCESCQLLKLTQSYIQYPHELCDLEKRFVENSHDHLHVWNQRYMYTELFGLKLQGNVIIMQFFSDRFSHISHIRGELKLPG